MKSFKEIMRGGASTLTALLSPKSSELEASNKKASLSRGQGTQLELSPEDEQLVAEQAAEYFERWRESGGTGVEMQTYIRKLPPHLVDEFKIAVNTACMIEVKDP